MLAPDFIIDDGAEDGPRRLSDLRGGPVLLSFHPDHWDPSRSEQVALFDRALDPQFRAEQSQRTVSLVAPLDRKHAAAAYGVAGKYAVFLIDSHGFIRWKQVSSHNRPIPPGDVAAALEQLIPLIDHSAID